MLYALQYPFSFAVLVVAFIVGLCARGFAQRLVSGRRQPAWARKLTRRRSLLWLKPFVDPYGCVAALIGGTGWGTPAEVSEARRRPSGRMIAQLLSGPVILAALGTGALVGFGTWFGEVGGSGTLDAVVHGNWATEPPSHIHYQIGYGQLALFLAGVEWLAMGILAIMPLPPLDGGRLLFALAPKTLGWQKAKYRLDDENWGVLILLILALPVIVSTPILISFLGHIIDPLLRVIT